MPKLTRAGKSRLVVRIRVYFSSWVCGRLTATPPGALASGLRNHGGRG